MDGPPVEANVDDSIRQRMAVTMPRGLQAARAVGLGSAVQPNEETPMFEKPSIPDLRQAARQLGMTPSDDYLRAVEEIVRPLAQAYAALDAMPDELPAVKYPRGPAYRPQGDENKYGAWYVKTSIKGKPGGPLAGRRIALKDNVCLAGVPR
jgi:hypothetical protein